MIEGRSCKRESLDWKRPVALGVSEHLEARCYTARLLGLSTIYLCAEAELFVHLALFLEMHLIITSAIHHFLLPLLPALLS